MKKILPFLLGIVLCLAGGAKAQAGMNPGFTNIWKVAQVPATTHAITVAPLAGDNLYIFFYTWNSTACPTLSVVPSGFTQIADSGCSNSKNELWVYTHQAGSAETSYSWTESTSSYASIVIYDVNPVKGTLDAISSFGTAAGVSNAITAPSVTTTQTGDLVISEVFNAFTTDTSVSSPYISEVINNGVFGDGGYQANLATGTIAGATVNYASNPSYSLSVTLAISAPYNPTTLPGNLLAGIGGPSGPTSVSLPVSIPPIRDTLSWYDEAGVASFVNSPLSTVQTYCDYGVGHFANAFSTPVTINNCNKSFLYTSIDDAIPNASGRDTDFPWAGGFTAAGGSSSGTTTANCPSGGSSYLATQNTFSGSFGTETIPNYLATNSENWFTTVHGGTIGQAASMGAGILSGNFYYFYVNTNSLSLRAWFQAIVSHCNNGGVGGIAFNIMTGSFEDNTFPGLESKNGDIWDDYPKGKNFDTATTNPYADPTFAEIGTNFNPSGFFNGTFHTRLTQITSSDIPATFPNDTDWENSQNSLMGAFFHADGVTPWYFLYNGGNNNNPLYLLNGHVLAEAMEEYDIGCFGTCNQNSATVGPIAGQTQAALGWPASAKQIIDNLAGLYNDVLQANQNPNAHVATLTDMSGNGGYSENGANHQQGLRWHYFIPMVMANDNFPTMWMSWLNVCPQNICVDSYGFDYTQAAGRYQSMPSDAYTLASGTGKACGESTLDPTGARFNFTGLICDTAGARDTVIQCPGTSSGMWCVEFAHYYVEQNTGSAPCTAFTKANWVVACVHDIGPALVIVNGSTTNYILNATNLSNWAPHIYASISAGHLVTPCNPAAGYFNWTNGGTTYVYQYALPTTQTSANFTIVSGTPQSKTITVASATQIKVGDTMEVYNNISGGVTTGYPLSNNGKESVTVTAVSGTSVTATFSRSHAPSDNIQPSDTVCTGITGEDFVEGGAPASGDAVYHTQTLAGVLGDTISQGQAIVIVP